MILLRPDDPPYLVGVLPPIPTHALCIEERRVYLVYERWMHIRERRTSKDEAPATFVLRHLSSVIASPTHIGALTNNARCVEIYSHVPQDVSSGVLVSLKCLDGETWINTAYPMGIRTLLKYVRAKRMQPISAERY